MALYQGELLEGLVVDEPPFEEWLLAERERLRELAIDCWRDYCPIRARRA